MQREIILLLQEKASWESISKYLGKDLFQLDITTEEIVINPDNNDTVGDGRIYVKRHTGIFIAGTSRTKIVYDQGAVVVSGQEMPVWELVLTRMSGRQSDFWDLTVHIAKKFKCILESRTYEQRATDTVNGVEFGRFHVKEFSSRTVEDALHELIWWHLCGISQASAELNLHAEDRLPVRRMRVEIRKLRAVLAMLDRVLDPDVQKWREKLRVLTIKLSRLREIDVALSAWRSTALNRRKYQRQSDKFSDFLVKERNMEKEKILPFFALTRLSPFLLEFMNWIMSDPIKETKENLLFDKIAHKKLGRWYNYMQKLFAENPDFKNDELAHEMRIKARSVRYLMQSMSGKAYGDENKIMRSLKRLLDALGVLHDNCVNEQLAKSVMRKQLSIDVNYQAGIFTGNERGRAIRIRQMLPGLWEKFSADWEKWY